MQVFKLFFKILRENKASLIIFFVITFVSAVLFVKVPMANANASTEVKPTIVIENNSDSEYAKGMINYLNDKCEVNEVDSDAIEDALFYRQISYVLYIPENFEAMITSGNQFSMDVKTIADSSDSYLASQYVETYIATIQSNIKYSGKVDAQQIIKMSADDLNKDVKVTTMNAQGKEQIQYYLNFLGYTFCSCVIGGVGYAMYILNKREIRRRNIVAPLTNTSMNIQQLLAFIFYSFVLGVVAVAFAYILFPSGMSEAFAPYMVLNTFVTLVPALGLAYLIGTLVTSLEVQNGISNVLCLILAFVGGSFVPQQYLSDTLLKVGTFTPNYWFVKTNNELFNLQVFDFEHLKPMFTYMGIQILFGIVFFLIAVIYSKQKRKNVI